jgi:hypothetical protein
MLCACTARSNMSCCAVIAPTSILHSATRVRLPGLAGWLAHELHAAGAGVHVWSDI